MEPTPVAQSSGFAPAAEDKGGGGGIVECGRGGIGGCGGGVIHDREAKKIGRKQTYALITM